MSTLQADSPVGRWVGFQILAGVGSGAGLQLVSLSLPSCKMSQLPDNYCMLTVPNQGIISIQGVTIGEELSSGMAFMIFTQALFPAIVLSLCNLVLVSSLKTQLPIHAVEANATAVTQAGATDFRSVVDSADLAGVVVAYVDSVDSVFYLVAAMVAVSSLFIWGIGWQDLREKVTGAAPSERDAKNVSDERLDG